MPGQCGLASARAVRALLDVQRSTKPDMFFLSETHLGKAKAETLMRKLGCDRFAYHESDGRSGGLMMCWRSENKIRVFGDRELHRHCCAGGKGMEIDGSLRRTEVGAQREDLGSS